MVWSQLLSSRRTNLRTKQAEASRSAFEQDYDRIIFAHPFRRLQDKTQVHPLPEHDFVHTRLTHSLEVSSVGRSLGRKVGELVLHRHPELNSIHSLFDFGAIVAAASLAHDLGNPPFGHAGEDALSEFFLTGPGVRYKDQVSRTEWQDLIQFEGNAQGFRILNRNRYGLRLTCAVLGAFTKYPWASGAAVGASAKRAKFGFFQSEREAFHAVASECGLIETAAGTWSRHPLAYLVEAADDICYSLIDLEDACILGLITYEEARSLYEAVVTNGSEKLERVSTLHDVHERIGYLRALAIGDLIDSCAETFIEGEAAILAGKLNGSLVDLTSSSQALRAILQVSRERIYRARQVVEIEASGHEVLPGLLDAFTAAAVQRSSGRVTRKHENLLRLMPEETVHEIMNAAEKPYTVLRCVLDFVSGLTDRHALSLFGQIKGHPRLR